MYFRLILSGTLAFLLMSGASVRADGRAEAPSAPTMAFDGGLPLPKFKLPAVFRSKDDTGSFKVAQAGDPRITALEEQVRSLSGTIEELNFQILQMQEQMRKMQEDNEFRFQELEGKRTDAGAPAGKTVASAPARQAPAEAAPAETPAEPEILVDNGTGDPAGLNPGTGGAPAGAGEPPQTFGTITFDEKGNVTGGSVAEQPTEPLPGVAVGAQQAPVRQAVPNKPAGQGLDETRVAALPATDDPDELYRNSYEFILSGDYDTAEKGFRDHIERFPSDQKAADANFWLGEALLAQKKYRDAAEVFLAANKDYPSSKKAPDMLLKLGMSLVGLDQRDVACATYAEIGKRYPDISVALKDRVKQEQALAAC
ncbi:tol-pal system protein YbgF [Mesorhizobium sp. ZMM04-5]|uniref:Cell division coordinator CpoB n=1 Tax=Mesorhizobium marinum TaxID=3228790 RepID=A0ABV3QYF7_9HYPH